MDPMNFILTEYSERTHGIPSCPAGFDRHFHEMIVFNGD